MKRRVKRLILVVVAGAMVASACGSDMVEIEVAETAGPRAIQVADRTPASADPTVAGGAVTAFGADIFEAARREKPTENVTLSPLSIAIALAMLEPGAVGDAQTQLHDVLHIEDSDSYHESMNALEQALEAREPGDYGDDSDPGELALSIANAAYLQDGYPFDPKYLDVIGSSYGPVLNEVDFGADPDAVAHEINDWVADQTEDRIPDLIGDGVIDPATVLALVNALYMNASWLEPFSDGATTDRSFTLLDGTTTDIALMNGSSDSSSRGDGWVGATKAYTGGLYIQFILPDEGRFDEVAGDLPAVIDSYPDQRSGGTTLVVPKFETRTGLELSASLKALGLTAPYQEGNLLGIANDPTMQVDKVIHETFLAIDEQGTEAAAATVVLVTATSAPAAPPVPVILDRPFLYRIMDRETGATLFIGQVMDPTA